MRFRYMLLYFLNNGSSSPWTCKCSPTSAFVPSMSLSMRVIIALAEENADAEIPAYNHKFLKRLPKECDPHVLLDLEGP